MTSSTSTWKILFFFHRSTNSNRCFTLEPYGNPHIRPTYLISFGPYIRMIWRQPFSPQKWMTSFLHSAFILFSLRNNMRDIILFGSTSYMLIHYYDESSERDALIWIHLFGWIHLFLFSLRSQSTNGQESQFEAIFVLDWSKGYFFFAFALIELRILLEIDFEIMANGCGYIFSKLYAIKNIRNIQVENWNTGFSKWKKDLTLFGLVSSSKDINHIS